MAQEFADDFGGRIAKKLMNVDVRLKHVVNHEVTQLQREQGRIDWRVRCGGNMKKISKHEVTPIYQ